MMKNFIEKFKSAPLSKKIMFIAAVVCIIGMLVYKFVINNAEIQLGIPYLITTVAVYLAKIAILLLAIKLIAVIIQKLKDRKS